MNELERLKSMLLELNQNQLKFSGQLRAFEALQGQISHLQGHAREDAESARKLQEVNDYMDREGHQAQRQIMSHIGAFESSLQGIRSQLQTLVIAPEQGVPGTAPAAVNPPPKKRGRNFA